MSSAHQRAVVEFLRDNGATNVRIEPGGKHLKVVYTYEARERFYVIPSSLGDSARGTKNAISNLRHSLGLVTGEKRVGVRRVKKRAVAHAERVRSQTPAKQGSAFANGIRITLGKMR